MNTVKLLSPTGHLGFTPIESDSFWNGIEREPDFICADSGSCDIGPYPFGSDQPVSPENWQKHDLDLILRGARELDVPMIIGSASDTGSDRGVDQFARLIKEIAAERDLESFTMAKIYSDVPKPVLYERLNDGETLEGAHGRPDLTRDDVDQTDHIVAPMGVEPYLNALEEGADVIIAGRSTDAAVFAAPALWAGIPEDIAFYTGKVLECASFVAEPFAGKESVIGTADEEGITVEPMSDYQRATPESVASHAMYERSNPFIERLPGGYIDMEGCTYEQLDERRTRVTDVTFEREDEFNIKLEGAGKVGERCFMIVGIRDPYLIENLDDVIDWSREKAAEQIDEDEYELHYQVYGRDGVMADLEPRQSISSHEVGVVVEGVASELEVAKELTNIAGRNFMYARLPDVKGTAGSAAFPTDEVLEAKPAYEWTINHLIELEDELTLHDIDLEAVGGEDR